eukprot:TRINITY_DN10008_c0_g1_i1.p3 TRINITY_DN10008_c0_g1~~TRINITY_DN10008_c0_g1_i1.p3  ORF type:complete len:113 (-),score=11.00 TRINITY_DN10008_c0_g1_i1:95-433(-)
MLDNSKQKYLVLGINTQQFEFFFSYLPNQLLAHEFTANLCAADSPQEKSCSKSNSTISSNFVTLALQLEKFGKWTAASVQLPEEKKCLGLQTTHLNFPKCLNFSNAQQFKVF